ncbi:MAG: DUF1905 domain-containing protein [Candidatus Kerfeldbacteria bacterium]|jgi:uncharacterized protein DUF1905
MSSNQFKLQSKVWQSPGKDIWHFVSLPKKQSKDIMIFFQGLTRGFGSLPVNVTVGRTKWKTSIFPDKKNGMYILPLKKEVRNNENIQNGDTINLLVKILI